ncbi:hypothetical protein WN48_07053 [Eufriesea mexicana]|uniref:Uncharacterized protein n=1 Tax=Eufriesea mexicana TaxID=516756 RepID=A0A310SVY8_9HYME|nr:hypothetical protein WN48_07053 [Eufriesea mexicana]
MKKSPLKEQSSTRARCDSVVAGTRSEVYVTQKPVGRNYLSSVVVWLPGPRKGSLRGGLDTGSGAIVESCPAAPQSASSGAIAKQVEIRIEQQNLLEAYRIMNSSQCCFYTVLYHALDLPLDLLPREHIVHVEHKANERRNVL